MNRPAGFWTRLFAFIVDAIALIIINLILLPFIGKSNAYPLLLTIITWVYFAGHESSARQATWGKHLFSLKVTDLSGNRISFTRATGRHFSKFFSALLLFIGYAMIAFTPQKQGLHDKLTNTLVTKRYPTSPMERWEDDDSGYNGDQ